MTDLQQRYRGPRVGTRALALVVIAAMVVSGIGFTAWAVLFHSTPKVSSQLTSFDIPDEHLAVAEVVVARESQFTDAMCRVRALAADHSVVGEVTVPVTDGPAERSIEVEIRTEREATSVQNLGCTAPGQPRPR